MKREGTKSAEPVHRTPEKSARKLFWVAIVVLIPYSVLYLSARPHMVSNGAFDGLTWHLTNFGSSISKIRDGIALIDVLFAAWLVCSAHVFYRRMVNPASSGGSDPAASETRLRELEALALEDSLTGLANRRHLDRKLAARFAEARRYGYALTCAVIDLDDFKQVNDELGHSVGDQVLIAVAEAIQSQLRVTDFGSRFGGDEFVLLLPHTTSQQAIVLANRIREDFFARRESARLPATNMSIGLACTDDLGDEAPDALLNAADESMYKAKQQGKNEIHVFKRLVPATELHVSRG